ncbi:MAG: hydrolase [Syntrophales bacterium]
MLKPEDTVLLLIDFQEKLFNAMHDRAELARNTRILIKGLRILGVPMIVTEQYPEGIGPTLPEVASMLSDTPRFRKLSFSCCGDPKCNEAITAFRGKHFLVAGIETHVCVYQTVMDLLDDGFKVQVVSDAVSSRTARNRDIGLRIMENSGAVLTSTEIILFELMKTAESEKFREVSGILK